MATSRHRHQSSLEGIIDFSSIAQPLLAKAQQRTEAINRFYHVVKHFEVAGPLVHKRDGYNRPALIRLTFEYARSPASQDRFLSAFFQRSPLGCSMAIVSTLMTMMLSLISALYFLLLLRIL
ncbi:hypothetical protein B0T25DRAFT_470338 [Lasiosphaeria hispida]|uniref:Uncharacterized protein n=1 Tax=Lasiosphaeria hispida TaxID=260671 RepID=A0AAJ0HWI6_9PEZI|nr:hypothetical protein B0T25DRAFT_470338 [Lasiosphaeria hispida]